MRYIRDHGMRHPIDLGEAEIVAYLTYLAAERRVSRSTQMQALSAILLLYREVLDRPVSDLRRVLRSTSPTRLPAVLSRGKVRTLRAALRGPMQFVGSLLSGAGLRLLECLTLRVKDLDFAGGEIRVRRGKGGTDRVTMRPGVARVALERQVERLRALHAQDLRDGAGRVVLPTALDRKARVHAASPSERWVLREGELALSRLASLVKTPQRSARTPCPSQSA